MIRLLSRYLLRTFLPNFLLALVVMLVVMAMVFFVQLVEFAAEKGISFSWTLGSFGDLAPYLLSLALPVAFLVAFLLTLAQLTESGELTAMRASGFSFREILSPFFGAGAALSLGLLVLNHALSPIGYHKFRDSFSEGLREITRLDFEPRTLLDMGPFEFFARTVDKKARRFSGALLYREGVGGAGVRVEADTGGWTLLLGRGVELVFDDGRFQLPNTQDPDRLALARFKRYTVYVPFLTKAQARTPSTRELPTPALLDVAKTAASVSERAQSLTEVATRSATALAPLVFFCVAAPLGLRMTPRGRSGALALSLVLLFVFYALLSLGVILGNRALAWSLWAPWLADGSGLAAGAFLARGLR